jgi:hypothetical protein
VDDEAGLIRSAFNGWMCDVLRFKGRQVGPAISYERMDRLPPLLPLSTVGRLGALQHSYIDSRRSAIRRPGSGLLRWGEPFVDKLMAQAEADDRGHAFAVRRRHPKLSPTTPFQQMFRFDVKISAGYDALDEVAAPGTAERRALERRLQRYLGPWLEAVWLSPRHEEVPEAFRKMLEDPSDLDDNLAKLPDDFDQLAGPNWAQTCAKSQEAALRVVAAREATVTRIANALAGFRRDQAERRAQDAARRAHLHDAERSAIDDATERALEQALSNPQFHIEACGVVFLGPVT